MYFQYFVIISPWKKAWPFVWTNLNLLHLRMRCAKFGWKRPRGSGEEDKNVKSLQQRRRRLTDKFRSEKLTWAFGSYELKRGENCAEHPWECAANLPYQHERRGLVCQYFLNPPSITTFLQTDTSRYSVVPRGQWLSRGRRWRSWGTLLP